MKQVVVLLCVTLIAVVNADKPFPTRNQPFSFPQRFGQRQTAGTGETEDLTPPSTSSASPPSGSSDGPYPPSGQPASGGPYPPSGWKPQGQRLELPSRQTPSPQYGTPSAPVAPQQQYGGPSAPPAPQQQYGAPPQAPQQQYDGPTAPPAPQQQYGTPQAQPGAPTSDVEPVEQPTASETPEQAANNRLRQQLRQQRLVLLRLRQQVRDQQQQLQQPNSPQAVLEAKAPAAYYQDSSSTPEQTTYVARLQFMDVPQVNAPVFSYSSPLVQVS